MAARTRRIANDENTRSKIQATQLINRLTDHALDKLELSTTQVRAIEILLKKVLPDMQSIEMVIDAEIAARVSVTPMSADEWQKAHNPA